MGNWMGNCAGTKYSMRRRGCLCGSSGDAKEAQLAFMQELVAAEETLPDYNSQSWGPNTAYWQDCLVPPDACHRYFEGEARELSRLRATPAVGGVACGASTAFRFGTGAEYCGHWDGAARHGFGTQVWPDGAMFEGQFVRNSASGLGRFTHADGAMYLGQWANSMPHGMGCFYHGQGRAMYLGQWTEGVQDGHGIECQDYPGSRYEGLFSGGRKVGSGCHRWPDGSIYFGQWEDNTITGMGLYQGSDGRCFEGQWRNAELSGLGRHFHFDGDDVVVPQQNNFLGRLVCCRTGYDRRTARLDVIDARADGIVPPALAYRDDVVKM